MCDSGEHYVLELNRFSVDVFSCRRVTRSGTVDLEANQGEIDRARDNITGFAERTAWLQNSLWSEDLPTNYVPGPDETGLAQLYRSIRAYRTGEKDADSPSSTVPSARTAAVDASHYLDLVQGNWPTLFSVSDDSTSSIPPWVAPAIHALSGNVEALRATMVASDLGDGALTLFAGLSFKNLGFEETAFDAMRVGIGHLEPPERAHYYVPLAELAYELARPDVAGRCLRWAVAARPDDDRVLLRAVRDLIRFGEFGEASKILERRADRKPPLLDVFVLLGDLALWCGQQDEARAWVTKAAAINASDEHVRRSGAILDLLCGDTERALATLTELEPSGDAEVRAWLAEILVDRGETDRAQLYLNLAKSSSQTPAHALVQALFDTGFSNPNAIAVLEELGDVSVAGDRRPTGDDVRRVLRTFHGNRGPTLTRLASDAPGTPADLVLVPTPPDDMLLVSRNASADLLRDIREHTHDELHERFRALTEQYPDSPHPWCYWGELRLWLGEFEEARACFSATPTASAARWAYVGRAAVHVHDGHIEDALAEFKELSLHYAPVPGATTHVYLGELHRLRGAYDQAVEQFEIALSAKPGRIACHLNLALCHIAENRHAEAIAIGKQLEGKHPRMFWDAARALGHSWPAADEHLAAMIEQLFVMMRGNRSSHTVTYFDSDGTFRIVEDAGKWREEARLRGTIVEREIMNRLTGSPSVGDPVKR